MIVANKSYFSNFPFFTYNGSITRNLTRKAIFDDSVFSSPYSFLPYTIQDGDKPEDVAYYYYGDCEYVWLVYLANNITDPYNDWPLSEEEFQQSLIMKYSTISGLDGYDVISWTMASNVNENRVRYENIENTDLKITPESYDNLMVAEKAEWSVVRIYDDEVRQNDNKRNIFLINVAYLSQAVKELENIINV